MKKTKKLTVWDYMNNRDSKSYRKQVRLLDNETHKNLGYWWDNSQAEVKAVKITAKYVFIFI